jgi:hypothetical protein
MKLSDLFSNLYIFETMQPDLFPGYDDAHRAHRLNVWLGVSSEIASKRPKVLYHATTKDFDRFREKNKGFASALGMPLEVDRTGIFLAENPEFAEEYITDGNVYKAGAMVMPVFLSARKTFSLTDDDLSKMLYDDVIVQEFAMNDISLRGIYNMYEDGRWELFDGAEGSFFVENLKSLGYDSAMMKESSERGGSETVWVAFNPTQIKSATGNRGSFSTSDASIIRENPKKES